MPSSSNDRNLNWVDLIFFIPFSAFMIFVVYLVMFLVCSLFLGHSVPLAQITVAIGLTAWFVYAVIHGESADIEKKDLAAESKARSSN